MSDKRCIRFASLGELSVDDLELAVDVWLDDALKAPWASKESMKLAGVLCRYMLDPAGDCLNMKSIEDQYQLNSDSARRALVLFALYGMIDAYTTEKNELRAALRLSRLQMFRVVQIKREMNRMDQGLGIPRADISWSPVAVAAPAPDTAAPATAVEASPPPAADMSTVETPATEAASVVPVAEVISIDLSATPAEEPAVVSPAVPQVHAPAEAESAPPEPVRDEPAAMHSDPEPDYASLLQTVARRMRDEAEFEPAGPIDPRIGGLTDLREDQHSDLHQMAHLHRVAPVQMARTQVDEPAHASAESRVVSWSSEPVAHAMPQGDAATQTTYEPQAEVYTQMPRRRGHMLHPSHPSHPSQAAGDEAVEDQPKSSQDALARSLQRLQRRMAV